MIQPRHDGRAERRAAVVAFLGSAVLAVYWTWPLAARLTSRIPHDPGDPIFVTWVLWWNAHAVPFTSRWWNAPMFYPLHGSLALSEHLAGMSLFSTPAQLLGASPIVAYNITLLLSYALSAFFAFLLVRRLTGSSGAAACAAVAFGFAPYRAGQLSHVQVLTSQWIPVMFLGLHGYLEDRRRVWLVVFGASWVVQSLANGYYMLFLPVLVALWLAWFVPWRRDPRIGLTIAAVWVLSSLALLPTLLMYLRVHTALQLSRSAWEIQRYSGTLASFAHPAPLLSWWPSVSLPTQEDYLFPGITAPAVLLIALCAMTFRRRVAREVAGRSPLLFYALASLCMFALALGPGEGGVASAARPYWWLTHLPGFDGLRAPARFTMLAVFCLSVAVGLALARVRRGGTAARIAAMTVVLTGLTVDGVMTRLPVAPPPPRVDLPDARGAAVIELPPDNPRVTLAAMYRATDHGRPLVNGYSGYEPPHYGILWRSLRRGDTTPLLWFARDRPLFLIVDERNDPGGDFARMVEGLPRVQRVGAGSAGAIWLLPPQGPPVPTTGGREVPATAHAAGREQLVLDTGATHVISAIEFPLRNRYEDLAPRIRIEVSDDGVEWRERWLGWTGGLAMAATLEDPRHAPVRMPLTPTAARYVRIYPAPDWLRDEVRVLAVR